MFSAVMRAVLYNNQMTSSLAKIVLAFLAGIGAQIQLYGKIRPRYLSRLS
jgi:hypothetical protein